MKTIKEVAQVVLERRHRPNPTVMQGEMLGILGEDGMSEAINRRWLVPSYDTGYLQVTGELSKVQEMEEIAQLPDPVIQETVLESSRFVVQHARRSLTEANVISEIAAPATGAPAPAMRISAPAASPAAAPNPADDALADVGDDVAVVENGRTFQGKIQSKGPTGRYKISFGAERPGMDREYEPNDFKRVSALR